MSIYSKEEFSIWLCNKIFREEQSATRKVQKTHVSWSLTDLESDQQEIILQIMSKLKEWFEWDGKTSFEPLQLTVTGKPGTGKSVVIQVIQNLCYTMFKTSSCVQVCAPTGGAAYNTGGQTCHRQWGLSRNPSTYEMSTEKRSIFAKCV